MVSSAAKRRVARVRAKSIFSWVFGFVLVLGGIVLIIAAGTLMVGEVGGVATMVAGLFFIFRGASLCRRSRRAARTPAERRRRRALLS